MRPTIPQRRAQASAEITQREISTHAEVDRSDVAADVAEVLSFLQFQPRDITLDTERSETIRDRSEQRASSG